MERRVTSDEAFLLLVVLLTGLLLRAIALDRQAVEHFDEGIYASVLWHDAIHGGPFPARSLYAPPLLSGLISLSGGLPLLRPWAPFLPALLLGTAAIPVMWWLARSWFGCAAGLFAAAIVAFSDYHVLLSRMALTDVPCLTFLLLAVGWGVRSVGRDSLRSAAVAGVLCGVAWWFKYTGWLPVAIVASGSGLWWLLEGRRQIGLRRLLALQGVLAGTTFLVWSPWLWWLQADGGYSAVAANHRGYLSGLSGWQDGMARHLANQLTLDGFPAVMSVGGGLLLAGVHRWLAARRSTWNGDPRMAEAGYPPTGVLLRFVIAAGAATLIGSAIWTPLLLSCLAAGGLAGLFLWPVLRGQWRQWQSQPRTVPGDSQDPFANPLLAGEVPLAPTVNPLLAQCTCLSWIGGLLLTTPFYHPYPRLMLPMTAGVWLAASGGVGWWIEANLSVARRSARSAGASSAPRMSLGGLAALLLLIAATLAMTRSGVSMQTLVFDSRLSIRRAAGDIADLCRRSAAGQMQTSADRLPSGTIIRPDELPASDSDRLQDQPAPPAPEKPVVVYGFGEPSLLFHLPGHDCLPVPVAHLNLAVTSEQAARAHSFLVIGPNAKRTPGFWETWLQTSHGFERVGDVAWHPSAVPLLNLFSPGWLREHPESLQQTFEVYRIRPRRPDDLQR